MDNYKRLTGQVDEQGHKLSTNTEANGRFHTDWLNMMYPRLKLARSLLTEDGVIFISIDDNEIDNLKERLNLLNWNLSIKENSNSTIYELESR